MLLSSYLACFFNFPQPAPSAELLVAAAADLARLEQPLADGFQKGAGDRVRFVLGSSGMLARQIENGAPYDVFLSANEKLVSELASQGKLYPTSVGVYAVGRLGRWAKNGSDIGSASRIAIANPAHAPYGLAARQALERLGLWTTVQPRLVYAENVRQALQFAESGNVDVALTSWSLVFDRGGVLVPAELHAPIRQAAGVVKSSRVPALARSFLDYLASPAGRALLGRYGLFPPP